MKKSEVIILSILTLTWSLSQSPSQAALTVEYTGNGKSDRGGAIGMGTLALQDKGTWVSATLNKGGSFGTGFGDNLVLFLDTASGGFTDTSSFAAAENALQRSVSGYSGTSRSTAVFAGGFGADYAIALGVNNNGVLYHFATDGSLEEIKTVNLSPRDSMNNAQYTFSFDWSDIGLGSLPHGFRFQSSYVTDNGVHYLESFESTSGLAGFGKTVTYDNCNSFGTVPVPEMTNAGMAVFGALWAGTELISRGRRWLRRREV
jgi:hypothetical protein